MTRATHLARGSAAGAALAAIAICAAGAGANPRGSAPAGPVYSGFPSAIYVRHVHPVEVQPQVHPQAQPHVTVFPGYIPLAISPLTFGTFGTGLMGLPPSRCQTQQTPMTLGELAPGGNTAFAPVTQSMLGSSHASAGPGWLESLTSTTPFGLPQAPWQLAQAGAQQLSLTGAQCAASPAIDFPDLQTLGN
jgi:hypothetical protein